MKTLVVTVISLFIPLLSAPVFSMGGGGSNSQTSLTDTGDAVSGDIAPEWTPAGDNIRTRWAEKIDPHNPLPEYPRPQMIREKWMNLNGQWNYGITDASASDFEPEGKILVPFAVESSLSGVGKRISKDDALWYERTFTLPEAWREDRILLHFGAVDWQAEVFVNGYPAGLHTGGYDPFSFDITPYLKKSGQQTLRVKVKDATDNSFQPRGKQCIINDGIWYTPVSGIWQTVWIEPVPLCHVRSYYTESDISDSTLTVYADAAVSDRDILTVTLYEGGVGYSAGNRMAGAAVARTEIRNGKAVIRVPDMKLWSPDSPYLYALSFEIVRNGKVIDRVQGYTAIREISVYQEDGLHRYKRLALNGKPLFQFGPLDQGWWPDGLYTAPSDEALKFDIETTKSLGFNMIRKHIKVEPARWYWWCDVLGMMVWQDMPCIGDFWKAQSEARDPEIAAAMSNVWAEGSLLGGTDCDIPERWKDNFRKEWKSIIGALKSFQCIVVWVPFNEGWGQFDTEEIVEFTKSIDSSRLVNEASGGNFSLCGDIIDIHNYPAPTQKFFERNFVNVVGEYGGIGYVVPGHTWNRAEQWGYDGVKTSAEELMSQYESYLEELKALIRTGCAAAVYTQTTDVEGEVNGLITYDRAVVKADMNRISSANKAVIKTLEEELN